MKKLLLLTSIVCLCAQVIVKSPSTENPGELDWNKIKTHEDTVLMLQLILGGITKTNGIPKVFIYKDYTNYDKIKHLLK